MGRTSLLYAPGPSKASPKPLEAFSFLVQRGRIPLHLGFLLFLPAPASSPPLSPAFVLFLCCAARGSPLFSSLFFLVFRPTLILSSLRRFVLDGPFYSAWIVSTVSDSPLFLVVPAEDRRGGASYCRCSVGSRSVLGSRAPGCSWQGLRLAARIVGASLWKQRSSENSTSSFSTPKTSTRKIGQLRKPKSAIAHFIALPQGPSSSRTFLLGLAPISCTRPVFV